jgi:inositol transport system ATP-binding protein
VPVATLSVAEQQLVEIARALTINAKLIILDEPTAALSGREVEKLHAVVRELRSHGISVIYVTHRLNEVHTICDRFTVLRDGRLAGSGEVSDVKIEDLVRLMVGRNVETSQSAHSGRNGEPVLRVERLTRAHHLPTPQAVQLHDISFELRRGEILGLAGLVGAGRTDLVRLIFGAEPFDSGNVYFEGQRVEIRSPDEAIRLGIALVPEDRKQQGLFLTQSVRQNLTLPSLGRLSRFRYFVSRRAENTLIDMFRQSLHIRMPNEDVVVGTLSGGNQQKVVLARFLALKPKVLMVDEPTRGIDVGAKAEVHGLLRQLAAEGTAVLVVSSELPEIMSLCDRIITVREGRLTGEMLAQDATEEILMRLMALAAGQQHAHTALSEDYIYEPKRAGISTSARSTPISVFRAGSVGKIWSRSFPGHSDLVLLSAKQSVSDPTQHFQHSVGCLYLRCYGGGNDVCDFDRGNRFIGRIAFGFCGDVWCGDDQRSGGSPLCASGRERLGWI